MHRLLERDEDVAFDVVAALLCGAGTHASGKSETTRAAEVLLEEITETRAAEIELMGLRSAPASRWRKRAVVLPIHAKPVVFPAFFRIAQDFIGFIDLLELFLGRLLILGDVRVVLAREFAERLLDVRGGGVAWHAEDGVVVFEFDGHGVGTAVSGKHPVDGGFPRRE